MKTIGIFAGSFNPFHLGHLDVLNQAKDIFDEVLVAKGINREKDRISDCDSEHINYWYEGLLTNFIEKIEKENPKCQVVLVRGLRDGKDLVYEQRQLFFLKEIKPNLKCIFILCNPEYKYISSSAIRALEPFNKHLKYIPK